MLFLRPRIILSVQEFVWEFKASILAQASARRRTLREVLTSQQAAGFLHRGSMPG